MTRALVLAGGGITGIAWELGVVAGLLDAGLDLRDADLVVGTSAGSVVGAQLRSACTTEELFARQLRPPGDELPAKLPRAAFARFALAMVLARGDGDAFRRRVGALAVAAADAGRTPSVAERRAVIAARLPEHDWPARPLVVTAVDVATGARRAFDRDAGAGLVDAVGASCAVPCVWPPVPIEGARYVDGGVHSGANADLARGCDRVVVLAPLDRRLGLLPAPSTQVAALGVPAVVVSPSEAAREAIGANVLDPAARAPSARAGRAQAAAEAPRVRAVWGG